MKATAPRSTRFVAISAGSFLSLRRGRVRVPCPDVGEREVLRRPRQVLVRQKVHDDTQSKVSSARCTDSADADHPDRLEGLGVDVPVERLPRTAGAAGLRVEADPLDSTPLPRRPTYLVRGPGGEPLT